MEKEAYETGCEKARHIKFFSVSGDFLGNCDQFLKISEIQYIFSKSCCKMNGK